MTLFRRLSPMTQLVALGSGRYGTDGSRTVKSLRGDDGDPETVLVYARQTA